MSKIDKGSRKISKAKELCRKQAKDMNKQLTEDENRNSNLKIDLKE